MFDRTFVVATVFALTAFSAQAQSPGGAGDVSAGREFAIANCSECHLVVQRRRAKRPASAPPDFADIAATPGMTRAALFVFLHTPHPTMPNLVLSDRNSNDIAAYILSLKPPKPQ